jgi:hypothetical protein
MVENDDIFDLDTKSERLKGSELEYLSSDTVEISRTVKKLASYMVKSEVIAKHRSEFYSYRQELVEIKHRSIYKCSILQSSLAKKKEKNMIDIKTGKSNSQYRPNNLDELSIMQKSQLADEEFEILVFNKFIDFVLDSLKSVDHMIYGIEQSIILDRDYR